jgi:hypothetical protein
MLWMQYHPALGRPQGPLGLAGAARCTDFLRMRAYLRALRDERRQLGWKGLLRKRGWRIVALVVVYYLVRDTILYVLIPLAIGAGVL